MEDGKIKQVRGDAPRTFSRFSALRDESLRTEGTRMRKEIQQIYSFTRMCVRARVCVFFFVQSFRTTAILAETFPIRFRA